MGDDEVLSMFKKDVVKHEARNPSRATVVNTATKSTFGSGFAEANKEKAELPKASNQRQGTQVVRGSKLKTDVFDKAPEPVPEMKSRSTVKKMASCFE